MMDPNQYIQNWRILAWAMMGFLLMFIAFIFSGCKSTQYVPVESVRTEYIDRQHRDSILIMDSVYIREKGDTVWLTRWRTEYRDRLIRDSIIIRDSIAVPYPVEIAVEVEKKLSWWQNLKLKLGEIFLIAFLLIIIFMGYKLYRKIR